LLGVKSDPPALAWALLADLGAARLHDPLPLLRAGARLDFEADVEAAAQVGRGTRGQAVFSKAELCGPVLGSLLGLWVGVSTQVISARTHVFCNTVLVARMARAAQCPVSSVPVPGLKAVVVPPAPVSRRSRRRRHRTLTPRCAAT
jgi:hypothetical protein